MPTRPPVVSAEAMVALGLRLAQCHQIAEVDSDDHDEAGTLAHAIADLADSSRDYLEALPKLLDERLAGDDLVLELIGLRNELAHTLYHIEDPRFFREGLQPLRDDWKKSR
jgi:hypothetical protein